MEGDLFPDVARVFTVAELTRNIRSLLENKFSAVWVQGEISNYKQHTSGHQYFTLKDQRAAIACVIFRSAMISMRQPLADGAQVQIFGRLTVFEARGVYQLSVEIVQPRGLGLLQAKFEALKRKLEAEGLFEPARKKTLPKFPRRVGIITSPSGAAIRDILNVLQRRARGIEVLINPVRVQGTGAAAEIAAAIREFNVAQVSNLRSNDTQQVANLLHVEVIVLARGGGSLEDLWEFNEEIVARAIAASTIPIVSAIGHEIDFTIADFVADLRAPTPSAAAELIAADAIELRRRVTECENCLTRALRNFLVHEQTRLRLFSQQTLARELSRRIQDGRQTLDWTRETLVRVALQVLSSQRNILAEKVSVLRRHEPIRELHVRRERISETARRLAAAAEQTGDRLRKQFERVERILAVLGPHATLQRGYSLTVNAKGKIVLSIAQITRGEKIKTQVSDGEIKSEVDQIRPSTPSP